MIKVDKYDEKGMRIGEFELDPAVFGVEKILRQAMQEWLLMQLANRRSAHPKTKTRGYVRASTAKPYSQKGTGRARRGFRRSPLIRGGAVAHGPDGRADYTIRLPRKVRRAAMRSLLTCKVQDNELCVISDIKPEEPKTKRMVEVLRNMELDGRKVVFVTPERIRTFEKSVSNIPKVKSLFYLNLNPHDLMNCDKVVVFESAVDKIVEVWK